MLPPRRKFILTATVGGNELIDIVEGLDFLASQLHAQLELAGGGVASSFHAHMETNPEMTPELYKLRLKQYIEWKKDNDSKIATTEIS